MAEFEISFVVPELSGPFDQRLSWVEESMDVVVSSHIGLCVVTVTAEGTDAVSAGRDAATVLSSHGLIAERTYPDMVSRQDIADRLDVSRQAVGNWVRGERQQAHSFPRPVNAVSGGVWLWGDAVDWLRRTGRDVDELGYPTLEDHAVLDSFLMAEGGADIEFEPGRLGLGTRPREW